ncbi:hypothetical protein ORV05_27435 [Amycolatopsis cynarae]|uniref:Uncharacterized protein n=1 Tax=Amycolatopsis cynarae TaxID=2995223 RepID=A0ABY7AY64_9PSEU|nr:hypothetical protein [Amycolatopsis sp. HUAS 11-8]WAL64664.1 hypothetical protein ORV05_27435 [Amycolatopsis sp. HUAS 11-8]
MIENWGFSGPDPELYDRIADLDRDSKISLLAAAGPVRMLTRR